MYPFLTTQFDSAALELPNRWALGGKVVRARWILSLRCGDSVKTTRRGQSRGQWSCPQIGQKVLLIGASSRPADGPAFCSSYYSSSRFLRRAPTKPAT